MTLTGNDSRLPFALIFSLRSHFGRSRALTVFTIIAIAASVALATALEMSTRSVQLEIERTADALFGAAQLEVAAGGMGIPEDLATAVAETPGVLAASPLIDATFRLDGGPLHGQALHVLGVDFLSDHMVRGYEITQRELAVVDPLRLLTQLNAVIVTKELADRLGVKEGDVLPVRWSGRALELVIRGLLLPGGVADAYGGQVAAMDIYSLQELLGRRGWIDRVDVVANDGIEVDALREAVQARVAGRAQVRRSASRNEYADRVFGTVSLGVWIVAVIGVLVAVFLSYSTMSISVDRRIRELALLQSAGLEGRRVRRLVRTDALVLSTIGTALGLAIGLAISRFFFSVFSGLTGVVRNVEIASLQLTASTLLIAFAVGILVGFLGSLSPSRRATMKPPLEVLKESRRRAALRAGAGWRVALLLGAAGVLVSWTAPAGMDAVTALVTFLGSAVLFTVGVMVLWLRSFVRAAQAALDYLVPQVGAFAGTSLLARPTQTALTASGVGAIIAGISGILIVLQSVEAPITDLVTTRLKGGLTITAADPFGAVVSNEVVALDVVRTIRSIPSVETAAESYNIQSLFRGHEVIFVNREMDVILERGDPHVTSGDPKVVVARMLGGEAAVSEAFSRYFGLGLGDAIDLETPSGRREFRIAGLVRDYVGPTGSIHLHLATFDRYWSRPGATAMSVWPETPEMVEAIRKAAAERQILFITKREEISKFMARTLSGFTSLLYGLTVLASSLGAVAILNVMLSAVSERRREFGLLQSAGATRWLLAGVILIDGLLLAGFGAGWGIVLGVASAQPMLNVMYESLGWSLPTVVSVSQLLGVSLVAIGAAAIAAAFGAATARSLTGGEVLLAG